MSTAARLTERQLSDAVRDLAIRLGWACYHTFDSRRSQAGFPDWVLVRGSRLLFIELKSEKGRVSDAQANWLLALSLTPAEVHVWKPADWFSGNIEAVLRGDYSLHVEQAELRLEDTLATEGSAT